LCKKDPLDAQHPSPPLSAIERRENAATDFYSATMRILIDRFNNKERARNVYIYAVLGLTVCFVGVVSYILFSIAGFDLTKVDGGGAIAAFIGGIVSVIGAVFGLPFFIMKLLFDKEEDEAFMKRMMNMLDRMQERDDVARIEKANKDAIEITEVDLNDFDCS